MSDITINIKSNTDNIDNTIQDIVRPSIDPDNNTCLTDNNIIIYNCTIDSDNNITGYTDENKKAYYKYFDNKWYFGSDIGRYTNLVSLADRTDEERRYYGSIGGKKAAENREKKKTLNDLAKITLDQVLSEKQIKKIIGDSENYMPDNTLGSALIDAMIKQALNGSFKAFESIRDTAGYKPETKSSLEISADIMTDADRSLIDKALKTS